MVKCSECGYLASRDVNSRQLEETEQEIRETGSEVPVFNTGKILGRYEPPICFRSSPDYKAFPLSPMDTHTKAIKLEIQRERDCDLFTTWQQGFTPKEHREMLDRKEMLKWQAEREDADRKWRSKQEWNFVIIAGGFTLLGAMIAAYFSLFR
jgi:hypothetical protein